MTDYFKNFKPVLLRIVSADTAQVLFLPFHIISDNKSSSALKAKRLIAKRLYSNVFCQLYFPLASKGNKLIEDVQRIFTKRLCDPHVPHQANPIAEAIRIRNFEKKKS